MKSGIRKSIIDAFYLMLDKKVSMQQIRNLKGKIKTALKQKNKNYFKEIKAILVVLDKEIKSKQSLTTISIDEGTKQRLKSILYPKKQSKKKALGGFEVPGTIEQQQSENQKTKIVKSTNIRNKVFNIIKFTGDFKPVIGNPSNPFVFMIYGSPGSGKSSFSLMLSKYLSKHHNFSVLYWATEEGISYTIQEKLERFNAYDDNLYIADEKPNNFSNYDVFVIDSITHANITFEEIQYIEKTNPKLSIIFVLHATKDGKYRGFTTWEHWADTVLRAEKGTIYTQKNRFGANGEMKIY